jgi:hypothetical protein
MMDSAMLRHASAQIEISRLVIVGVAVDVVDAFTAFKATSQNSLHDGGVLVDGLSASPPIGNLSSSVAPTGSLEAPERDPKLARPG